MRMIHVSTRLPALMLTALFCVGSSQADDVRSLEEVRTAVGALHVEETPWRDVAWRTCLVEGLNESQAAGKPLILWIFIDRPIDDERC